MKRVIFDIILLVSIYIFPWWVSILLVLIGVFIFDNFYEFLVSSVIVYSMYATKGDRIISSSVFFPLIIIISYISIQSIKNNIILYKK